MARLSPALRILVLIGATALGGCTATNAPTAAKPADMPKSASSGALDPCANRLHDVCGLLLQYYLINRRLPESLSDLTALQDIDKFPLVCPVSGRPYLYDREGYEIAQMPGRVVIIESTPAHGTFRWAIAIEGISGPPTATVVSIPEIAFTPKRPAAP